MAKMRAVQPKIQSLKERLGSDKERRKLLIQALQAETTDRACQKCLDQLDGTKRARQQLQNLFMLPEYSKRIY